jgi:hypothetical protein
MAMRLALIVLVALLGAPAVVAQPPPPPGMGMDVAPPPPEHEVAVASTRAPTFTPNTPFPTPSPTASPSKVTASRPSPAPSAGGGGRAPSDSIYSGRCDWRKYYVRLYVKNAFISDTTCFTSKGSINPFVSASMAGKRAETVILQGDTTPTWTQYLDLECQARNTPMKVTLINSANNKACGEWTITDWANGRGGRVLQTGGVRDGISFAFTLMSKNQRITLGLQIDAYPSGDTSTDTSTHGVGDSAQVWWSDLPQVFKILLACAALVVGFLLLALVVRCCVRTKAARGGPMAGALGGASPPAEVPRPMRLEPSAPMMDTPVAVPAGPVVVSR